ncbi:unnamed protein product [Rhizophagus irregularis]|nr:unnamed protein product [Rhizophagus irregularis]
MAANFWTSTHGTNWLLSRQALADCRKIDRQYVNEQDLIKVNIWFAQIITDLGRSLQVRQVIIATAITYFKRFYTKNSFRNTEPNLVAATCMYLACKIEESPQHIKAIITDMKTIMQERGEHFTYDNQKVAEMEFYLLEELDFNMIMYNGLALRGGAQYGDYSLTSTTSTANDNSVAGVTTRVKDIRLWFAQLNVDLEHISDIVQEIISLYKLWGEEDKQNEKIREILTRLLK